MRLRGSLVPLVPGYCSATLSFRVGLIYSHGKVHTRGAPLTHIAPCGERDAQGEKEPVAEGLRMHWAPRYDMHPRTGDVYAEYNIPAGLTDWLAENMIHENLVLVVMDANTVFARAMDERDFDVFDGVAMSEMSKSQGGIVLMSTLDLRRIAPLWLHYTEIFRQNAGSKASHAYQYGFLKACAEAGVRNSHFPHGIVVHRDTAMYSLHISPHLIQYTPTTMEKLEPLPSADVTGLDLYKALLSLQVPLLINSASCAPSSTTYVHGEKCAKISKYERDFDDRMLAVRSELAQACIDFRGECQAWAEEEECLSNPGYMHSACRKSCNRCGRTQEEF